MLIPTTAADGAGIGNNLITTIMGGLSASFGEVAFKWVKRPVMLNNRNGGILSL